MLEGRQLLVVIAPLPLAPDVLDIVDAVLCVFLLANEIGEDLPDGAISEELTDAA